MSATNQQPAKPRQPSGAKRASGGSIPRQALFREVNERIEALDAEFGAGTGTVALLCECADSGCLERIEISTAAYEQVRRFPTRFLVRPGHVDRKNDRMIHENGHYVVVEKTGPDATEAVRLDPRRATPPTGDRRRHSN